MWKWISMELRSVYLYFLWMTLCALRGVYYLVQGQLMERCSIKKKKYTAPLSSSQYNARGR